MSNELGIVAGCDLRALRSDLGALGATGQALFAKARDALERADACQKAADDAGLKAAIASLTSIRDEVRSAATADKLLRVALRSPGLIGR